MKRVGFRSLALPAVMIALLSGALPVAAGPPWPYPPPPLDTGKVGVHVLVDTVESPAVRCRYSTGGQLIGLRIRRPIAFARDTTAGIDPGRVGWRWQVFGQSSSDGYQYHVLKSGSVKASMTDRRNAFLEPVVVSLPGLTAEVVRVRHTISWYKPANPSVRIGRAIHWATLYQVNGMTQSSEADWCYKTQPWSLPPGVPPGHSGAYGTHLIVDSPEYPGMTCVYSATNPYPLVRMEPNMAIAFNERDATDTLKRRFLVQWTSDANEPRTWHTVRITDPVSRTADAERNAVFPGAKLQIQDGGTHLAWRVVQRLTWPTPVGRADEVARYGLHDDGDPQVSHGECAGID